MFTTGDKETIFRSAPIDENGQGTSSCDTDNFLHANLFSFWEKKILLSTYRSLLLRSIYYCYFFCVLFYIVYINNYLYEHCCVVRNDNIMKWIYIIFVFFAWLYYFVIYYIFVIACSIYYICSYFTCILLSRKYYFPWNWTIILCFFYKIKHFTIKY